MRIEYRVTSQELLEGWQASRARQSFGNLVLWVVSGMGLILGIAFGLQALGKDSWQIYIYRSLSCSIASVLTNPFLIKSVQYNCLKHELLTDRTSSESSTVQIHMTPEGELGIASSSPDLGLNSQTKIYWVRCFDFVETPSLLVLDLGRHTLQVIPKRTFDSDRQLDRFRELLRQNVERNKRSRINVTCIFS